MVLNSYSVYDTVAAAFIPPFFVQNDALAKRAFRFAVLDEKHPFSANPAEYILYKVGSYDDTTGVVMPEPVLVNLGSGAQFGKPAVCENLTSNEVTTNEVHN